MHDTHLGQLCVTQRLHDCDNSETIPARFTPSNGSVATYSLGPDFAHAKTPEGISRQDAKTLTRMGPHAKTPRRKGVGLARKAFLSRSNRVDCSIRLHAQHPVLCFQPLNLCSAIPENRSFFGRFFSLTTACFFVRSLVSFLSDAGDAGVWLRLRRAMSWREIPSAWRLGVKSFRRLGQRLRCCPFPLSVDRLLEISSAINSEFFEAPLLIGIQGSFDISDGGVEHIAALLH
jgi:hypothetical protein